MGNAIPELLVKILVTAGYDNAISISEFNENDLEIVQNYTCGNLKELVKQYEVYNSEGQFEFLPGHRKLLLALPNKVQSYLKEKLKSKNENENEEHLLSAEEQLKDDDKIVSKRKLIIKLNHFLQKIEHQVENTENLIGEIETYNGQSRTSNKKPPLKCLVNCMFCEKPVSCTQNGHWQIGNLEKHIQIHIEEKKNAVTQKTQSIDLNNNSDKEKTVINSNNEELDEVLGLKEGETSTE